MIPYKDYRHAIPIQVRFSDVDRLGHVNNACYHNYVELGRVHYFRQVLSKHVNWDEQGFVLARTEIDHIEQLYLNDDVLCYTRVFRFGTKSVGFHNAIVRNENGKLIECAAINAVLVAMDYRKNVSIPVPENWKKLIAGFEGLDL